MNLLDVCTCRRCGKTGLVLDEFTSPYTGLCAECSREVKDSASVSPDKPQNQEEKQR